MEETIRAEGAIPATIAALDGRVHVGLEPTQLERLARTWEARGWLTPPRSRSQPRRVTERLRKLALQGEGERAGRTALTR